MRELIFGVVFLTIGMIGLIVSIKDGAFKKLPWGVDLEWLIAEIIFIVAGIVLLFRYFL